MVKPQSLSRLCDVCWSFEPTSTYIPAVVGWGWSKVCRVTMKPWRDAGNRRQFTIVFWQYTKCILLEYTLYTVAKLPYTALFFR